MHVIAHALGEHTDTTALRRTIFAYEFLQSLEKAQSPAFWHLEEAPLSVVEVIARWYAFDRKGALEAAAKWSRGIGTVRSITAEMHEHRPTGFLGKSGPAFERAYLQAAEPAVTAAVMEIAGTDVTLSEKRSKAVGGHVVDFLFTPKETAGDARSVAVLIVGPYSNKKNYIARCADWLTRAYGLAWLYDTLILAVPEAGAVGEYLKRNQAIITELAAKNLRREKGPNVNIVQLMVDPFAAEDHEFFASHST